MKETHKPTEIDIDSLLTSYQVGSLLQVNPSSVNKWVKDGRIPAFRTPGGHHRIRAADLVSFLKSHRMPVPRLLSNAGKRRVLIVDDDLNQLKSLERVFKTHESRLEIRSVDNGIDALVMVGALDPHVVVLDVFMPNLDGIEVCRRLRGMKETENIKVVITSAQLTEEVERQAREAGAYDCLQKPVDMDHLLGILGVNESAFLGY
ncbi:MAG: response regulator [Myxococcota bacterium]